MAPSSKEEFAKMFEYAIFSHKGPIALRYPKSICHLSSKCAPIKFAKAELLRKGKDVVIIAVGSMLKQALMVVENLSKKHIEPTLINARFIRPFDEGLYRTLAKKIKRFVIIEEGSCVGGFGEAVIEFLNRSHLEDVLVLNAALPNEFIEHGSRDILLDNCGLSPEKLTDRILRFLRSSSKP
jgi:1-deoxy-D-xylulose-5-phosphate synthase